MTNLPLATCFLQSESFIYVLYIVAFALFIQGLRGLSGPTDRRARQPHRRSWHGYRGHRDAAQPGRGQLGPDRARHRARHGRRGTCGAPGEDDRDAADGGALQRRRRRRGGDHRLGRVPQPRLHLRLAPGRCARSPAACSSNVPSFTQAGHPPMWRSSRCSPRSSGRSPSGVRTSPSASSRKSSLDARSRSARPSRSSTSCC